MSDSEPEDITEEDARIVKLYTIAEKQVDGNGKYSGDVSEFVQLLDELGTKEAIVYGGMCFDANIARAHFVIMALIDAEDISVHECVENMKAPLKAVVASGGDGAGKALI